jgi:hypothetical protein
MRTLEVIQTRQIDTTIRHTDATALQGDWYAAFIHASADDAVERAVGYLFFKDHNFQELLKPPEARGVATTLRILKAHFRRSRTVCEEACKRNAVFATNFNFCVGIDGMILHSNRWQEHHGASSRKNVDTWLPNRNCGNMVRCAFVNMNKIGRLESSRLCVGAKLR